MAARIPPADLPGLFEATCRRGLAAEYGGRAVLAWAKEVAAIAEAGLPADERRFLDPVREVLDAGKSPGMTWADATTPAEVLAKIGY